MSGPFEVDVVNVDELSQLRENSATHRHGIPAIERSVTVLEEAGAK